MVPRQRLATVLALTLTTPVLLTAGAASAAEPGQPAPECVSHRLSGWKWPTWRAEVRNDCEKPLRLRVTPHHHSQCQHYAAGQRREYATRDARLGTVRLC